MWLRLQPPASITRGPVCFTDCSVTARTSSDFALLCCALRNIVFFMIKSFADKELEKVFHLRRSKSPQHLQKRLRNRLELLEGAETLEDLAAIPGGYLEALKGKRQGEHICELVETGGSALLGATGTFMIWNWSTAIEKGT